MNNYRSVSNLPYKTTNVLLPRGCRFTCPNTISASLASPPTNPITVMRRCQHGASWFVGCIWLHQPPSDVADALSGCRCGPTITEMVYQVRHTWAKSVHIHGVTSSVRPLAYRRWRVKTMVHFDLIIWLVGYDSITLTSNTRKLSFIVLISRQICCWRNKTAKVNFRVLEVSLTDSYSTNHTV